MFYKRLTKRGENYTIYFDINDHEILLSEATALDLELLAGHLAFLEDKIESGDLVDRNEYLDHLMSAKTLLELTDKEIEFFVKHNAKIRKYIDEDMGRLTTENAALRKQLEEMRGRQ